MGGRPLRVGVVGAGGMGACHARNVAEIAGVELAWVADPDDSTGPEIAADLDCGWVPDANEAIDECDALVVACPDRFHAHFLNAALARRLPVLCEKPMTVELADGRRIIDTEQEIGRRLVQVGFMRVYDERHVQVADAVAGLGVVNHIRSVHRNTNEVARPLDQMLVESMIHDIHSARWLSGAEIVEVRTSVVRRDRGIRMAILTCRLSNGGVATLEFDDAAAGYEVSIEVSADRGNVVSAETPRAVVRANGSVGAELGDDWFTPFLATYRAEMGDWLSSIGDGVARGPSAWDGYAAQCVVAAAVASYESGLAVPVELGDQPNVYQEGPS